MNYLFMFSLLSSISVSINSSTAVVSNYFCDELNLLDKLLFDRVFERPFSSIPAIPFSRLKVFELNSSLNMMLDSSGKLRELFSCPV